MLADNPPAPKPRYIGDRIGSGGLFTRIPNFEVNIIVSSYKILEEIVPAKKFIRQLADENRLVA